MATMPRLQLLLPYQICFGLSSGFVGYYINAFVVSRFIGDGYIGFLSAMTAFTAMALALPYAEIANHKRFGKWYVMMFGGLCFFLTGFPLLVASDEQIANWGFLVLYFVVHGAARGAWESTNKATIAEYFPSAKKNQDAAFAAVYFTSGLAGATGFLVYQYMSRSQLALINTIVPLLAMAAYHKSTTIVAVVGPSPSHSDDEVVSSASTRYENVVTTSHHAVAVNPLSSSTVYGLNE